MNIKYETVEESSAYVTVGMVIRTSIDPGYNINVKDGQVLTVYISSGLQDLSSVDSEDDNSYSDWSYTDDDRLVYRRKLFG